MEGAKDKSRRSDYKSGNFKKSVVLSQSKKT